MCTTLACAWVWGSRAPRFARVLCVLPIATFERFRRIFRNRNILRTHVIGRTNYRNHKTNDSICTYIPSFRIFRDSKTREESRKRSPLATTRSPSPPLVVSHKVCASHACRATLACRVNTGAAPRCAALESFGAFMTSKPYFINCGATAGNDTERDTECEYASARGAFHREAHDRARQARSRSRQPQASKPARSYASQAQGSRPALSSGI